MISSLRVFIWNVNSWAPTVRNIVLKYGSIRAYFDDLRADIICLQEVKLPESKLTKELACVDGFESFWSFSRTKQGYSGVSTYVRSPFSPPAAEADCLGHSSDSELNCEGRLVVTDHGAFVLFNVYVPNAGDHPQRPRLGFKMSFLEALRDKMQQYMGQGRQVILVGDMNIASEQRDVHPTFNFQSCYSPQEVQLLHGMMQDFPDVWRLQHPDAEGCYTVWDEKTSARAFNAGLRIDYVLCSRGLLPQVVSCEIMDTPPKWSDHAGLLLELKDIPAVPKHQPCELSSVCMKRFNDRSQKSIFAAFGQKRPAAAAAAAGGGAASTDGRSAAGDAAPASAEDGPAGAPAAGTQAAGSGMASQQASAGAPLAASGAGDAEAQERPHKVPKLAGSSDCTPAVPGSAPPAAGAAAGGDSAQGKAACTAKAAQPEAGEPGQPRQAPADGSETASVSADAEADPNTKAGGTSHVATASAAEDSRGTGDDGQLPLAGGPAAAKEQQAGTAGAKAAGAGTGRQQARRGGKPSTAKKPGAQSEAAGKDGRKQQTLKAFFTKK